MDSPPTRVSFLLVSGFMMAAYVLALDALRLANWRDGRRLFDWDVRTPDDAPAQANNGMAVTPDVPLAADPAPEAVFICAGFSPELGFAKPVLGWLRALERKRVVLGGWDTGPLLLAEAGLMDGRRMALHWQAAPAVRERYPRVEIVSDDCHIESRRFTAPGGVSAFDLVVAFIEQRTGPAVARMVRQSANRSLSTTPEERAPLSLAVHGAASPPLARAVALMEQRIETPLSIPDLAAASGLSTRALHRLAREQLGAPPKRFYLTLRLQRARDLLRQSDMSVAEIAAATGFSSASRFAQAFRDAFDETPSDARRRPRWLQIGADAPRRERLVRTDA